MYSIPRTEAEIMTVHLDTQLIWRGGESKEDSEAQGVGSDRGEANWGWLQQV